MNALFSYNFILWLIQSRCSTSTKYLYQCIRSDLHNHIIFLNFYSVSYLPNVLKPGFVREEGEGEEIQNVFDKVQKLKRII